MDKIIYNKTQNVIIKIFIHSAALLMTLQPITFFIGEKMNLGLVSGNQIMCSLILFIMGTCILGRSFILKYYKSSKYIIYNVIFDAIFGLLIFQAIILMFIVVFGVDPSLRDYVYVNIVIWSFMLFFLGVAWFWARDAFFSDKTHNLDKATQEYQVP